MSKSFVEANVSIFGFDCFVGAVKSKALLILLLPCRHIYCVLNRELKASVCVPFAFHEIETLKKKKKKS